MPNRLNQQLLKQCRKWMWKRRRQHHKRRSLGRLERKSKLQHSGNKMLKWRVKKRKRASSSWTPITVLVISFINRLHHKKSANQRHKKLWWQQAVNNLLDLAEVKKTNKKRKKIWKHRSQVRGKAISVMVQAVSQQAHSMPDLLVRMAWRSSSISKMRTLASMASPLNSLTIFK